MRQGTSRGKKNLSSPNSQVDQAPSRGHEDQRQPPPPAPVDKINENIASVAFPAAAFCILRKASHNLS